VTNAGIVTQRFSATRHADSITLAGTFSPFTAGNLTALLLNNHGAEVSRRVLRQVHPEESVVLDDSLPVEPNITQIVLKLFNAHGADYGILDKTHVETPGVSPSDSQLL
jgi:hypothetical protein